MGDLPSQPGPNIQIETIRDDLVAYLDGELSAEEAARIERLVEQDARVREELQRLAETWDWLDVLDRPTVDEDFTRTTIEMVAQSAASEVASQSETESRARVVLAGVAVAGTLLALFVGWRVAYFFWENPNKWLIEHYAVIENQDYYRHVESLSFLRLLRDNGLFRSEEEFFVTDDAQEVDERRLFRPPSPPDFGQGQPEPGGAMKRPGPSETPVPGKVLDQDGRPAPEFPSLSERSSVGSQRSSGVLTGSIGDQHAISTSFVVLSDPVDIRKRIAALSESEKIELRRKVERFQKLSANEQQRMLAIHKELMAAPDRDELIVVLQRYYQWFKVLTPSQRGELEALKPEQRVAWIQKTRNDMVAAAINRALFNFPPERLRTLLQDSMKVPPEERLPPGDIMVLVRMVESLAAQRGEELLRQLSLREKQDLLRRLNQLTDPQQRKDFLAITWLQWQLDHPDQVAVLTPQELEELRKQLSPSTRERLESLSVDEQLKRVAQWIRSYVFFRYVMPRVWADMRRPVSEQKLGRFVEENLTREEREALLALPPDEMQRELTRRYLRWRYPGFDLMGPWRGHGGDRRGPRPGPGDREPPPGPPPGQSSDQNKTQGAPTPPIGPFGQMPLSPAPSESP